MRPTLLPPLAALILLLALPSLAGAAPLLDQTVTVPSAGAGDCAARPASGTGIVQRRVALPAGGAVAAKLAARSGDWDVAVFEGAGGRLVSSGGAFGANELAMGFVTGPRELIVQACRRKGDSRTARLTVTSEALTGGDAPGTASLL